MKEGMMNNVEVVAMIYRSTEYLDFIYSQLKGCKADGWNVGLRIVANDATDEVLSRLPQLDISFSVYNDPQPEAFYLNRVYRCWNYCVESSQYDNVCLVNSDMAFSEDWLSNLLKHHDGANIPCSRLVESGKMRSGPHGVSKNFGRHPREFDQAGFEEYAKKISEDRIVDSGLCMPVIFNKKRFLEAGKYPEGNVFRVKRRGRVHLEIGHPNDRRLYTTGDMYLLCDILGGKFNMKHVTPFDSIVYHIQEGEMDE